MQMWYTPNNSCEHKCICKMCVINTFCKYSCANCKNNELGDGGWIECSDFLLATTRIKNVIRDCRQRDKEYVEAFQKRFSPKILLLEAPKNNIDKDAKM